MDINGNAWACCAGRPPPASNFVVFHCIRAHKVKRRVLFAAAASMPRFGSRWDINLGEIAFVGAFLSSLWVWPILSLDVLPEMAPMYRQYCIKSDFAQNIDSLMIMTKLHCTYLQIVGKVHELHQEHSKLVQEVPNSSLWQQIDGNVMECSYILLQRCVFRCEYFCKILWEFC